MNLGFVNYSDLERGPASPLGVIDDTFLSANDVALVCSYTRLIRVGEASREDRARLATNVKGALSVIKVFETCRACG